MKRILHKIIYEKLLRIHNIQLMGNLQSLLIMKVIIDKGENYFDNKTV